MSDNDEKRWDSKLVLAIIITVILVGSFGWYFLTILGTERISPKRAKELAETFERECFLEVQDHEACKEHIGLHHRDCLMAHKEDVAPGQGDKGTAVRHDEEGYLRCMRENSGIEP